LPGRSAFATNRSAARCAAAETFVGAHVPKADNSYRRCTMSMLRLSVLLASLIGASSVLAETTGPTNPDKARQHPLDNREPRPDSDRQSEEMEPMKEPVLQPRQAPIESDVPPMPKSRDEQPGADVDAAVRS
jgi:hypothetical protein